VQELVVSELKPDVTLRIQIGDAGLAQPIDLHREVRREMAQAAEIEIGIEIEIENHNDNYIYIINLRGSGIRPGSFSIKNKEEKIVAKECKPRLVEATFLYQMVGPSNEKYLFGVRAARFGEGIKLRFDLHGDRRPIENLPPELLEAIRTGLELVGSRVKGEDLVELEA
jgi:hypothetical protein